MLTSASGRCWVLSVRGVPSLRFVSDSCLGIVLCLSLSLRHLGDCPVILPLHLFRRAVRTVGLNLGVMSLSDLIPAQLSFLFAIDPVRQ